MISEVLLEDSESTTVPVESIIVNSITSLWQQASSGVIEEKL